VEHSRLAVVPQYDVQYFPQFILCFFGEHGGDDFAALGEIAIHPVGGANKEVALRGILKCRSKMKNTRMLQIATDDRPHSQPLGAAWNAGPKTAEASDDQLDGYSGAFTRDFTNGVSSPMRYAVIFTATVWILRTQLRRLAATALVLTNGFSPLKQRAELIGWNRGEVPNQEPKTAQHQTAQMAMATTH
jgi:hypothetical protein